MSNLRNLNELISEIHKKITKHQKGNKKLTHKEVEDFVYFLRKSN